MSTDERPLAGKSIVITRAPEQAAELIGSLERLGAEVVLLPMVRFAVPEDLASLDGAIGRLAEFDWILFTSQNAVRFFAVRQSELGDCARFSLVRQASDRGGGPGHATRGRGGRFSRGLRRAESHRAKPWRASLRNRSAIATCCCREAIAPMTGCPMRCARRARGLPTWSRIAPRRPRKWTPRIFAGCSGPRRT